MGQLERQQLDVERRPPVHSLSVALGRPSPLWPRRRRLHEAVLAFGRFPLAAWPLPLAPGQALLVHDGPRPPVAVGVPRQHRVVLGRERQQLLLPLLACAQVVSRARAVRLHAHRQVRQVRQQRQHLDGQPERRRLECAEAADEQPSGLERRVSPF